MSIRNTADEGRVALFDSGSGHAFGPTLESGDEAEAFVRFAERESDSDLRRVPASYLATLYDRFRREEWDEDEADADADAEAEA